MAGIKESSEFLIFVTQLLDAGFEAFADGKFEPLKEFGLFIPALISAPAGIAGMSEIPTEAGDYTAEELIALQNTFESNFDIPQEDIEEFAEDTFAVFITGQSDLSVLAWAQKWIISKRIQRLK